MKIFIQILHQHCKESEEAAENRNYLAGHYMLLEMEIVFIGDRANLMLRKLSVEMINSVPLVIGTHSSNIVSI